MASASRTEPGVPPESTLPPLLDLGGQGPVVHLACANGFPPETYRPALSGLRHRFHLLSVPPRALWPDPGEPPEQPGSWTQLAQDILLGLSSRGIGPVVGIGHSFGAVATLLAAADRPAMFRALALLDPTIFPPTRMAGYAAALARGEEPRFPLIDAARKRRARFASRNEAFAYWRGKPLFADWSDALLGLYVDAMLQPGPGGRGLRLRWSPAWEAWYYRSFFPGTWEVIPRLRSDLPLLVMRGEQSETFLAEAETRFRQLRPDASFAVIEGHGHLFPHSAPDLTAELLQRWVASLP